MNTIKLTTAYQLTMTSLLVGACLGILGQRLPQVVSTLVPSAQAMTIDEQPIVVQSLSLDNAVLQLVPTTLPQMGQSIMTPRAYFRLESSLQGVTDAAMPQAETAVVMDTYELVEQQQHGEQITPRLFVYVHERQVHDHGFHNNEAAIGNVGVRVKKDGVELPTTQRTYAGEPGYTWPIPSARQQLTNLELEFPDVSAPGVWEIQLLDDAGNVVGPTARFVFSADELNQEMYVRYQKRSS